MSRARLLLALAFEAARFASDSGFLAQMREAAAIGRRLEDWDLVFVVLTELQRVLGEEAAFAAERATVRQEISGLLSVVRDPELLYGSYFNTRLDAMEEGDMKAVDEATAAIELIAGERRSASHVLAAARWRFYRAQLDGRFGDAEQLVQRLEGLSRDQGNEELAALRRYELRHMQGLLSAAEAEAWLNFSGRRVEASPELASARMQQMDAHRRLGRTEETRREFQDFAAEGFARLPVVGRLARLASLARACVFLGDRERAAQLVDLLLPYAGRNLIQRTLAGQLVGATSFYLALLTTTLERWQEAAEHFEAALAMYRKMGAAASGS